MIGKPLRISATTLESFRLLKTEDWMTEQRFMNDLIMKDFATPEMALGIAFDKIMQKPEEYILGNGHFLCNNHTFDDSMEIALGYRQLKAFTQYKAVREYEVFGEVFELVCKADALYGTTAWEYKTTQKPVTGEKIERFMQSAQWMAYADVFGLLEFNYLIFQLSEENGIYTVGETTALTLHPYEGLHGELVELLGELVGYIHSRNLETHFQPKQKVLA